MLTSIKTKLQANYLYLRYWPMGFLQQRKALGFARSKIAILCFATLFPTTISAATETASNETTSTTTPVTIKPALPTTTDIPLSEDEYSLSPLCEPDIAIFEEEPKKITDDKIYLHSDSVNISEKNITTFIGSVVMDQQDQRLTSDTAIYYKEAQDIKATGNVVLTQGGLKLTGDKMNLNLETNIGDINNATYRDTKSRAQGVADVILMKSKDLIEMHNATYSTCDPDSPDWQLRANTITLNKQTRQGSASNVVIRFKSIPFLYLPYIRFPLGDERLSGFLFPSFGDNSINGLQLIAPYYWNIHPQMDATITPKYMANRGLQLNTEFRYLAKNSTGLANANTLPGDALRKTDRNFFHWQHNTMPTGGWSGNVNFNYVSDNDYLRDFGANLNSTSQTSIERRADIRYDTKDWLFRGRAQGFQTLTDTEQIKRLPQLNLNTRQLIKPNEINTSFQSELVRFTHSSKVPVGNRMVLQPSVSLPLSSAAAYTTFLASLHYTQYDLDRTDNTMKKSPSRTVPILSINSGVYFERDSSFLGKKYLQTLEPRLQYLYIPYREQSNLPTFDTSTITTNYSQLFNENRYSGGDRINDANQITYGLTSRYISMDTGAAVLSGSIGQTFYFANNRVTLNGEPLRKQSWSDLELSVTFQPIRSFKLTGSMTRNQQTRKIDRRDFRLQYKTDKDHILNANYRFLRDNSETREISGIWKLSPQWQLIIRKYNDLRQNRELESVHGIQYDSCCWSLRLIKRRTYVNLSPTEPYLDTLFIEFELKGLSSFGQKKQIDTLLNRGILGYSN